MSSAMNHRKRSHRSEAAHYNAARKMKGSPTRKVGLYSAKHGLGIMSMIRKMFRREGTAT